MAGISLCFVGCGAMNARHARIFKRLRPGSAFAVASRAPEKARAFGARLGARDCFGSYEAALASGYDGLVIGTPPRGHAALIEAALAAGKHLLIEKPVVARFDELERQWPALKRHGRTVMVAENLHYAPFHRRLKEQLRDPGLGRPLILDLIRLGRSRPTGWRANAAEMPLGALHEGGVHWIRRLLDLASVFEPTAADQIVDVSATGPLRPVTTTPGEDTMMIVARHRSGLTSRLLHTWAVPWRFPPFDVSKVLLENGALYFDARSLYGRAYGPGGRRWMLPTIRDGGGYRAMWADFLAAAETGRPPALALEDIFADFAYMDAAYRSKASGRPEVPKRPPVIL
ncbi:MAG TPA: Gfo/Idh/MocA family oxidoreductase [Polyangia bacterium]|nr:Gfo/Idh/MocA family oxidoreductase [Polyangia bacterium]